VESWFGNVVSAPKIHCCASVHQRLEHAYALKDVLRDEAERLDTFVMLVNKRGRMVEDMVSSPRSVRMVLALFDMFTYEHCPEYGHVDFRDLRAKASCRALAAPLAAIEV